MKIDKYILLGLLFIFLSLIIFFTDFLNPFIRPFTHLILMGSSKGKDILFFSIFGLLLILSQLFEYNIKLKENRFFKKITSTNISKVFKLENNTYIKISLAIIIATGILGLILELIMRYQIGISPFTTFVSLNPNATTTSILHSHVYKSVIGEAISYIFSSLSLGIPVGINTGDSLAKYVPELANIIVIILPLLFLTQLASLKNRLGPSRILLTLASTVGLIGIFDGGLFSNPYILGIYFSLIVFFDENAFNYYVAKLIKNKSLLNKCREKMDIIKSQKLLSYDSFKRFIPHLFLIIIILLGISLAMIGSSLEHYEVNVINKTVTLNQLNDSLNSYSILSIQNQDNNTLVYISPEYNGTELLNSLINSLQGKCEAYSLSWNFYSYLDPDTRNFIFQLYN